MNEYLTSKKEISEKFELDNSMAVVVPKGDYEREAAVMAEIEELDQVNRRWDWRTLRSTRMRNTS